MFSFDEGKAAVRIARATLEAEIGGRAKEYISDPASFEEKSGVFVTLSTYPSKDLRGCIGYSEPVKPIKEALRELAMASATRDPRFPRVRPEELDNITIDVTLLTPPEDVDYQDPSDLLSKIVIGRDGLIAQKGYYSGLLLPQVPVEYDWDVSEFLSHTCMKAGLSPNEWKKGAVKFRRFSGQVFGEMAPDGDIEPVPLS